MSRRVKVRRGLLAGSLAVALIASIGIGWAISSSGDSPGKGASELDNGMQPPSLGTNAAVQGDRLPAIDVALLDGTPVSTSSLIGQPLVINIWGSTCGPCKKELPDFAKVHALFGDRVRFVGIDYLPPSDHEEEFARSKGVQYELLYDDTGAFIDTMGVSAFPVTLIITADGTIVKQTGQLDEAKLTALIEEHLL